MPNVLVDTDVFIDHLRGVRRLTSRGDRLWYSVVTRCELFAGKRADEDALRLLLSAFTEVPVDRSIAEMAGRLRRMTAIRTPDALIAASAIEHNFALVTRNLRDYQPVQDLVVRLPD